MPRKGGTPKNLKPWRKGQSGNPKGSSKKQRERALLSDFATEAIAEKISPERAKRLRQKTAGLVVGERLLELVVDGALRGKRADIDRLERMMPKRVEVTGELDTSRKVDVFVPSDEDQDELLREAQEAGHLH